MKRKNTSGMQWKYIIGLFSIVILGLILLVYRYKIDWSELATLSFYENLANPSVKIVRIQEGLRKEEIAEVMAQKLGWSDEQKNEFINVHLAINSGNLEGKYFPKTYMIPKDEDPTGVSAAMFHEFTNAASKVIKTKKSEIINQDTALKVASIIQREAGGKSDMKLISGIIWNRLFKGMPLQVDATLQYAKGNEEDGWWRQVAPVDKKIDSPYNTYTNKGLPPSPIANPGMAALDAAYNPQKTTCIYYMHDKNRNIHCSVTYEQHKRNIDKYY